jgi:hypothetical protein
LPQGGYFFPIRVLINKSFVTTKNLKMKKVLLVLAIGSFAACSNGGAGTTTSADSTVKALDSTVKAQNDTLKAAIDTASKKLDSIAKKVDSTIKK